MGSITGTIQGTPGYRINFTTPVSLGVTCPANEYPNGSMVFDNIAPGQAWWKENSGIARTIDFYLCSDTSGSNSVLFGSVAFLGNEARTDSSFSISNASALKGKPLYLKIVQHGQSGAGIDWFFLHTTNVLTKVVITTSVSSFAVTTAVSPSGTGTLTASAASATPGTTVRLTPTPNAGYHLSSYTTSPSVTVTSNQFIMPSSAITVTANFAKTNYTVTTKAGTGGSLSANKSTAQIGDTVTLTPTASAGYYFTGYTTSPSVTITNNSFTMPAGNVTITANFALVTYTITTGASTGGSLTANRSTATMGTAVTLTPTASTGYYFTGYTTSPSVSISNNAFTMPASNVSITANFAKITYTITRATSPSGAGTVATSANSAVMGTSISISQTPNTGYYFNGWQTSPNVTISGGAFTMPASNITVTAKYLRRSTASLNKSSMEGGSSVTLSINTESTAYTHKYKLSFGTGMETSLTDVAAGTTTVSISVPLSWSEQIPNATSKSGGTLVLYTYSGSTQIGSYTVTGLTYTVPASVKPTIGTITTSIVRTIDGVTYADIGDYYVQNHSGVRTQTSASGAQASTISSISLSINGYSGSNYSTTVSADSIDFTSKLLTVAGNTTITITATDSRGRTATASATIVVQAYSNPAGALDVWRCDAQGSADSMGEYGKYTLTKQYTQLGNNTLSWSLTVKYGSSTIGTGQSPGDSGDLLPGNRLNFEQTKEYNVILTLEDSFETTTITIKMPSARFIMYVEASGNRMGFMKVPNNNIPSGKKYTVEFSDDTQIYIGSVTLEDYIRSIS